MDLDSYQVALEEVLTWLLSAEDTFQEQEEISGDVEEVKEQFSTHEVRFSYKFFCCGLASFFFFCVNKLQSFHFLVFIQGKILLIRRT